MDPLDVPIVFADDRWQQCFAAYLAHLWDMSRSNGTLRSYRPTLARFFSDPGKTPDRYSRSEVEQFLHLPSQSRRNRGAPVTTSTVNLRIAILKSWYAWCADYTVEGPDGPVPILLSHFRAPTRGLKAGKPARRPHALSEQEIDAFFSVIPDDVRGARDRACFCFYLLTGRRRNEVASLNVSDIQPTTFITKNDGLRDGWVYTFANKGDKESCERAELPQMVKHAIDEYWRVSGRLATIHPTDPLFVAFGTGTAAKMSDTTKRLSDFSINYAFHKYARLAGLSKKFSIHSLRHTYAQMRRKNGASIEDVMGFLKHRSIATTYLYLQTLESPGDEDIAAIEVKWSHLLGPTRKEGQA